MYLEEAGAARATRVWRDIKRCFPYLPKPRILSKHPDDIYEGIASLLARIPSLGTLAGTDIPAPSLPLSLRKRHLYVVGKTGSGKTTFLEHQIAKDLQSRFGVGVIAPEGELFRKRVLPMVPRSREGDIIYLAPADPNCSITFNPLVLAPGEEPGRAAADLFTILARGLGDDSLGVRGEPILQNLCAALVGHPGATLLDFPRFLTEPGFRARILEQVGDEYTCAFWHETFPRFPKGAATPLLTRLDRFLRPSEVRRTLCNPVSTLSVRDVLEKRRIFLLDLFGLPESVMLLFGQLILAKFQLELLRREKTGTDAEPFFLYADEFQAFGGVAEGTWRELMSRGRKYGLALTLAHQYPAQLPLGLQREVRNANSLVSFRLSSPDAESIRGQFLHTTYRYRRADYSEPKLEPLSGSAFVELPVGTAYMSLGGGRAAKVAVPRPLALSTSRVEQLMQHSWKRYGAPPWTPPARTPRREPPPRSSAQPEPHMPTPAPAPTPRPPQPSTPPPPAPTSPAPSAEPPAPPPPPTVEPPLPAAPAKEPGRGGPKHTYLQSLIQAWGKERGFRAEVEHELPGGGRVDVALMRDERSIAVEIAVTTGTAHEVENVRKCLAASFDHVVVVAERPRFRAQLTKMLTKALAPSEHERVEVMAPDELLAFLEAHGAPTEETTVAGFSVAVSYHEADEADEALRSQAITETIVSSLRRLEGSMAGV